jgi:hypothetical protein
MNRHVFRSLAGVSVLGMLALGAGMAQAQQQQQQVVQARVISATPIRETTGSDVSYNVTYEYNGRQYTTRTDSRPGATIPVQATAYGVTTSPVAPQPQLQAYPVEAGNSPGYSQQYEPQYEQQDRQAHGSRWDNVVPEPGVVVSDAPAPAPVYARPAPVYAPPVYVQPAYAYPYAQPYVQPYAYPPVGLSLNFGYSRGWGGHRGGWRHRHWR